MTDPDPIDTAWRIHAALTDWTGKVDSKASFALAIESALIVGLVNLSAKDAVFGRLSGGWQHSTYWAAVVFLVGAVLMAVSVVVPKLRRRHIDKEWRDGLIYFGHLRRWDDPRKLAKAIKERDLLPVLSRQLINMSEIAWKKHAYMQLSVVFALAGTALLALCAVLVRTS